MVAVGKIQHPQHGHILSRNIFSTNSAVEPTLSKLRFAFRHCVVVDRIVFDNCNRLDDLVIRFQQMLSLL